MIHLLEIIRLSDFSSPLFYPSLLVCNAYNSDAVNRTVHLLPRKYANTLTKKPKKYVFCFFYFFIFFSVALYRPRRRYIALYTDKKENQFFLIYEEIQNGAVAQSYITNSLLIHGEIFSHFLIFEEVLPHI
jgi:hypothetical protein